MTEELNPKEARQGGTRKNVLIILVVSTVLCVLAFTFVFGGLSS